MKPKHVSPLLVAIVGGSGAGKSWLADQLQKLLGDKAGRISQDDFYRDRSHLPPGRRALVNFDHPRAIDWAALEAALKDCLAGKPTWLPQYDFATHSRLPKCILFKPKPVIILDGLWLLRRPSLRRLFQVRIFIDCPTKLRLHRRLGRDLLIRGRDQSSVQNQFWKMVEPMNALYVAPQSKWAHILLDTPFSKSEVRRLAGELLAQVKS
ncbi:uridine kinase family protein [Pedosphaera parvula]|uniref:Uridine kinase n=1 Tax=Pedosphaera parvula (strain Ellin514) TaxID=320771 RepID=B9XCG0_PEDPL|nr:uridine kinase [Pedosphaera parvula]EEF62628.1 Uridine kinase [Pedosphaera parvula Ellin514]